MAAFINTSILSTTMEDALLELAERIAISEANTASNPTGVDNMSVAYSANGQVNISFSAPVTKSINATGQIVTSVTEYLV